MKKVYEKNARVVKMMDRMFKRYELNKEDFIAQGHASDALLLATYNDFCGDDIERQFTKAEYYKLVTPEASDMEFWNWNSADKFTQEEINATPRTPLVNGWELEVAKRAGNYKACF